MRLGLLMMCFERFFFVMLQEINFIEFCVVLVEKVVYYLDVVIVLRIRLLNNKFEGELCLIL